MVRNDQWIRKMAAQGMIEPFDSEQVRREVISYGVSAYGYDIRIADEFRVPHSASDSVMDPKNFDDSMFSVIRTKSCILPARSYALCRSLEYLRIPRDVLVICFGKSTYARSGILVNVTPLEPEWEGYITISVSNTASWPVRIYAFEGIAQLVFLKAEEVCATSYADKKGKYQAQQGIVSPKVERR